jgi:hypothetical protein
MFRSLFCRKKGRSPCRVGASSDRGIHEFEECAAVGCNDANEVFCSNMQFALGQSGENLDRS